MPHASHRLGICLLPADPAVAPDSIVAAWCDLDAAGWLAPGSGAVRGGHLGARLERLDHLRFYSSGQGGFGVRCPCTGSVVTAAFARALEAWRAGGIRALACACGDTHDLAALVFLPEAAFSAGAIAFADVGSGEIEPRVHTLVAARWGRVKVVLRRG